MKPAAPGRGALVAAAAAIGYALGYALPAYAHLPNLYYDPVARRFLFGPRPGPVPMGYYGQVVYGVAIALLAAAVTAVASRARGRPPTERGLGLATAWALTALALVAAYFTWNNWP